MIEAINRNPNAFNQKFTAPCRILGEGVYMSTDPKITHCNSNTLCIGGAGTGKGYRFFRPNILREQDSIIVNDPDGIYYDECRKTLEQNGFTVKQLVIGADSEDSCPDWESLWFHLRNGKMALFIHSAQNKEGSQGLADCFANMVKTFLNDQSKAIRFRENRVTIYLDEAANIGEIKELDHFLTIASGWHISCILGFQSVAQIQALYHDQWKQAIANFSTILYLGGSCLETCQYISMLIRQANESGKCDMVLSVEEIAAMDRNNCLIFVNGESPLLAKKYNFGSII